MTRIVILTFRHVFAPTKQSTPLPVAHITAANEQRTYANSLAISHRGYGEKNKHFLVRNNYCKTLENP